MAAEIYKLAMPQQLFVFVVAQSVERLDAFATILQGIGGVGVGPQAFCFYRDRVSPESIRDALGVLAKGECVYSVDTNGERLESYVIAAPRTEGGIAVGS